MAFQREVTGVEKLYLGVWDVAPEGFGARRNKEWVILAPHREKRRPLVPEILLERRVKLHVRRIVEEQVELDVLLAWPSEKRTVERIPVRRNAGEIGDAVGILKQRRFGLQEVAERVAIGLCGLPPSISG